MEQYNYLFECWDYWNLNVQFIEAMDEAHAIEIYKEEHNGTIVKCVKIA
jgi:hypothetical protein